MYTAVLLHVKEEDWAGEFELLLRAAFRAALQTDDLLSVRHEITDELHLEADPVVVVYLANADGRDDDGIRASLDVAKREAFAVIPVKHASDAVLDVIPTLIGRLNAVDWEIERDQLMTHLLRTFNLIESERRLFLSYRRGESSTLALQLRDSFSQRNYDVFLDRFSVPPGEDFQDRLDRELADKAFVLLIESPSSVESPWIQHEVTYAMSHHIGICSIVTPDTPGAAKFDVVDDAFRIQLEDHELKSDGALVPESLERVLRVVELAYARQIRRRRAQLLGSVADWLFQAGWTVEVAADWALFAQGGARSTEVIYVTPRAPIAADLRLVDQLRQSRGGDLGRVVHDTLDRHPDNVALIQWIVSGRPLEATPLPEIPVTLGLP